MCPPPETMTGLCDPRRSRHSRPSFASEDPPLLDPRHGTTTVAAVTPASSPPRTLSSGRQQAGQSHGTHSGQSFARDSPHRRSTPAQATPPPDVTTPSKVLPYSSSVRRRDKRHTRRHTRSTAQVKSRTPTNHPTRGSRRQQRQRGRDSSIDERRTRCLWARTLHDATSRHVTGITRRREISLPLVG